MKDIFETGIFQGYLGGLLMGIAIIMNNIPMSIAGLSTFWVGILCAYEYEGN